MESASAIELIGWILTASTRLWYFVLPHSEQLGTENFIHTSLPHALSAPVLNALKANALSVDLRQLATHFYALGERMVNLVEDAEEELVDTLSDTFKKRAMEIADHAVNPRGALGEGTEFLMGLEESERQSKSYICLLSMLLFANDRNSMNIPGNGQEKYGISGTVFPMQVYRERVSSWYDD